MPTCIDIFLSKFDQSLCFLWLALGQHLITSLEVGIILQWDLRSLGIELQGILSLAQSGL